MTDRELLVRAAEAAGIEGDFRDAGQYWYQYGIPLLKTMSHEPQRYWNPLKDDRDALRLAVKLGIAIDFNYADGEGETSAAQALQAFQYESHGNRPYAATRRAIVRAAAEIGKDME